MERYDCRNTPVPVEKKQIAINEIRIKNAYIKLPKELAKRLKGKHIELIPEEDRIVVIPK
jgi:hypothetical protein